MAISFPLSAPNADIAEIDIHANSMVGESRSPFTMEEQVFVHQGEWWEADIVLPPMKRADAAEWIGTIVSLNGKQGTLLLGDPLGTSPRGTWAGSPKVVGPLAAGLKSIPMDGFTAGATVKRGDWLHTGTGFTTHLHQIVKDGTADGSGLLTLEIWPRTRVALADNDTFTTSSAKGIWRLASNRRSWSLRQAQIYGIRFALVEALSA